MRLTQAAASGLSFSGSCKSTVWWSADGTLSSISRNRPRPPRLLQRHTAAVLWHRAKWLCTMVCCFLCCWIKRLLRLLLALRNPIAHPTTVKAGRARTSHLSGGC